MKTSIKTLTTICAVVISLNATAQHRSRGNENQPQNQNANGNNNPSNGKVYASAGVNTWNHWGGGVSIHVGNYPNYGSGYYGNGYHNSYNIRKAARNSIRQSANVIGQALQFSDWNDMYSPWLAKAIRHQQYAKQLYFWGDYAGALNHAERAGFLAWNTLSYFNSYNGYGGNSGGYNNYPNPYSDPNNPYYKQGNTGTSTPTTEDDSDFGYRKQTEKNNTPDPKPNTERKINKEEIDTTLPQSKMSDKELLKMDAKELDIE